MVISIENQAIAKEALFRLKSIFVKRGSTSIRGLRQHFRKADKDGSGTLCDYEFVEMMNTLGLSMSKKELEALMQHFDSDDSGTIDFEEFVSAFNEPLNKRCQAMVQRIFDTLDVNKDGEVTCSDLKHIYHTSKNKDVISGKITEDQLLNSFLAQLQGPKGNNDNIVTIEELTCYFTDLRNSCPSDEYFIEMLESAWLVSEDGGVEGDGGYDSVGLSSKDISEWKGRLKLALYERTGGKNDEGLLRSIIGNMDEDGDNVVMADEFMKSMVYLGVSTPRNLIRSILDQMDSNCDGVADVDELVEFVMQ